MAVARPKQARTQITHARIVEGAARALVERGYHGATSPVISQYSEVSQGAIFKHFENKTDIFAAAVEALLAVFVSDFRDGVRHRVGPAITMKQRVAVAVRSLWNIFRTREMSAVFDVYVAARTDTELQFALRPILEVHRENILTEARALFPEVGDDRDFASVVDAVVYAMQGVALGLFPPPGGDDELRDFFERLAIRELEATMVHRERL